MDGRTIGGRGGYGAHPHAAPGGYTSAPGNYLPGVDPYNNPFSLLFPPGTDPKWIRSASKLRIRTEAVSSTTRSCREFCLCTIRASV
ncbi:hypothetical protein Q3G72_023274 [Acer saccharum]|nr:hypothetical protein Q3G72_023274 [Acer saccharum]